MVLSVCRVLTSGGPKGPQIEGSPADPFVVDVVESPWQRQAHRDSGLWRSHQAWCLLGAIAFAGVVGAVAMMEGSLLGSGSSTLMMADCRACPGNSGFSAGVSAGEARATLNSSSSPRSTCSAISSKESSR